MCDEGEAAAPSESSSKAAGSYEKEALKVRQDTRKVDDISVLVNKRVRMGKKQYLGKRGV